MSRRRTRSRRSRYPRYVPVAERRAKAERAARKLAKDGHELAPVEIEGRAIAKTFWGKAWCRNLEDYSDYANRLPRGRTYARNGSILDLGITPGAIEAMVAGSRATPYRVRLEITPLMPSRWAAIRRACAGQVGSLVELLSGELSSAVMEIVTRPGEGLFPSPREIKLDCSCPDWASMCKHVAASLYGVGARLDHEPALLFTLRGVDPAELVEEAIARSAAPSEAPRAPTLEADDLSSIFGVDIDLGDEPMPRSARTEPATPKAREATEVADLEGLPASAIRLLCVLRTKPGLRSPELAKRLGVSRSTVANAVKRLKERGLVRFEGAPRSGGYYPEER